MPDHGPSTIDDAETLREILGPVAHRPATKERPELGEMDRRWLAASPLFLLATSSADGRCDVSPRGDPSGAAVVLDSRTLVLPERPGNRRGDSLHNILENPHVGLIFLIPGRGDTLRINGRARLLRDAPCFERMVVKGHRPKLAIEVQVEQVYFHCSKAFLRAGLWKPETWAPDAAPPRAAIAVATEQIDMTPEELAVYYGPTYGKNLYG